MFKFEVTIMVLLQLTATVIKSKSRNIRHSILELNNNETMLTTTAHVIRTYRRGL